jgi:plasmid maintenance system killer protein
MWTVFESASAAKTLAKAPREIREKYDIWLNIVRVSGPQSLRLIKGFHDEVLRGKWAGHRSSRLNIQYRVIYRLEAASVRVYVVEVTAHDYRRR